MEGHREDKLLLSQTVGRVSGVNPVAPTPIHTEKSGRASGRQARDCSNTHLAFLKVFFSAKVYLFPQSPTRGIKSLDPQISYHDHHYPQK